MRIDIPGSGNHWVELRDADSLTAADHDVWMSPIQNAWLRREEEDGEVSADGVSAKRPAKKPAVTAETIRQRVDGLLASLITGWSYAAPDAKPHIPLPYAPAARKVLSLAAGKALDEAIKPHQEALNADSGPKEPPPPESLTDGGGSRSTSPGESQNHLPDLTLEPSATAST
jgi:hypothetical protein